jgi:hypothetical protein
VHGWSKKALRAASQDLGMPLVTASVPANGPLDLIDYYWKISLEQTMSEIAAARANGYLNFFSPKFSAIFRIMF